MGVTSRSENRSVLYQPRENLFVLSDQDGPGDSLHRNRWLDDVGSERSDDVNNDGESERDREICVQMDRAGDRQSLRLPR